MDALYTRYASQEMQQVFSELHRAKAFRLAWIGLARTQMVLEVGCVTREQVFKLCDTIDNISLERIQEIEKETKHDVMAHLKHWAEIAPEAAPILHLGATSSYVTDNADSIIQKEAMRVLQKKYHKLLQSLSNLASTYADTPILGYTHFQPAQPTTLGKRIAIWIQDIFSDVKKLDTYLDTMRCRGAKGTTGTQASFVELFDGNKEIITELFDRRIAEELGFDKSVDLSGQTYPRKLEAELGDVIAGAAMSFHKMGVDIRLMCHTGEISEEFGTKQVGSSAMPYKRNPITAERLCSLARLLPHYRNMLVEIAEQQWLERSLDDSAARRIAIPHMFLVADAVLETALKLTRGLQPNIEKILKNINDYKPFLAVEQLMIRGVKAGGNRQELHETLRNYAIQASTAPDPSLEFQRLLIIDEKLMDLVGNINIDYNTMVGMAPDQVRKYLDEVVYPYLGRRGVSK